VYNGSVSTEVEFNVYLTLGDDFDFFGYAVDPTCTRLQAVTEIPSVLLNDPAEDSELQPQAAAFANVSSQDGILNHKTDLDTDSMYDMRPIKSVRDHIRRFVKVAAGFVPVDVFEINRGLFRIAVADLIGVAPRIGTVDPVPVAKVFDSPSRNIISKMFYGFNGGTKFKLVVNGSTIAEAWYVPPSYSNVDVVAGAGDVWVSNSPIDNDGSDVNGTISQMFRFPERLNPVPAQRTAIEYSVQTPSVERPNYINVLPGYILKTLDPGTDSNRIAHACTELEFMVPYMSSYRFAGDYSKFGYTDDLSLMQLATHGLGYLVFRIAAPEVYSPGVLTQQAAISYEIFVANTDEARLGYQINAPQVVLPAYKVGNTYYQLAASISPVSRRPPLSTVSGAPGFPVSTNCYACYFAST